MKTWQEFMPDILPDVYGCPDPTVVLALRRTARQFFEQAHIWRLWLDPVRINAGVLNHDLDLAPHADLVKLERATLNGREIDVVSSGVLSADWQTNFAWRAPCVFTEDRVTFNYLPAQTTGDIVQVEVILKPSNDAAGIDDIFFDQYVETLAMGAKARLMQQPQKSYSNPALGMELERRFNDAITDLNIRRAHGFSAARLTVQPRSLLPTTRSTSWL